jgi:ABC-type antimicrobial peptide transport system permease subunit
MPALLDDLRYCGRLLRRAPVTVAVSVLSLGLGVGATTAVFSFVNAVQFSALPVADEDRLVGISETSATELCQGCSVGTSYPAFQVQHQMASAGIRLAAAGLLVGLPAAWVATRTLEGILAGTSPTDPFVFTLVSLLLAGVTFLASWIPARRAAQVDPVVALRQE